MLWFLNIWESLWDLQNRFPNYFGKWKVFLMPVSLEAWLYHSQHPWGHHEDRNNHRWAWKVFQSFFVWLAKMLRCFKSISEICETWRGKPISFITLVSFWLSCSFAYFLHIPIFMCMSKLSKQSVSSTALKNRTKSLKIIVIWFSQISPPSYIVF